MSQLNREAIEAYSADHLMEGQSYWQAQSEAWTWHMGRAPRQLQATGWEGLGAEAAIAKTTMHYGMAQEAAGVVSAGAATASMAAGDLMAMKSTATMAIQMAEENGFTVGNDLSVKDKTTSYPNQAIAAERQAQAQTHASAIATAATALYTHDSAVAKAMDGHTAMLDGQRGAGGKHGHIQAVDAKTDAADPAKMNAGQFAQFWSGLTPAERDDMFAKDPSIGNHDGMPFADANKYNRQYLPTLQHQAEATRSDLQSALKEQMTGPNQDDGAIYSIQNQLAGVGTKIDGYKAVENDLAKSRPVSAGGDGLPRYLARIDQWGHGAVSIGNPDTASHNAVFVPGTGQDLSTMSGADNRAVSMFRAAQAAAHPGDVSVTTWMGYDRPMEILPNADSPSYARAGAGSLDQFMDSMRATNPTGYNTVIGHSYGSTEVGAAASGEHHLDANAILAVGSPGMLVDHASDLHADPGAPVYVMANDNDIIPALGPVTQFTLGAEPDGQDFGATQLQTEPGPSIGPGVPWFPGHSSYWSDPAALSDMGAIIDGQAPPFTKGGK